MKLDTFLHYILSSLVFNMGIKTVDSNDDELKALEPSITNLSFLILKSFILGILQVMKFWHTVTKIKVEYFYPSSTVFSDPRMWECFVDVFILTKLYSYAFCLVAILCTGLYLLQRGFPTYLFVTVRIVVKYCASLVN